jgi:hypothetical protein
MADKSNPGPLSIFFVIRSLIALIEDSNDG